MNLTRRELLEALVVVALLPAPELRKVECQTAAGWEQVRMADLKAGSIFRIHCPEDGEAHLKPYRAVSDGYWINGVGGVQAEPA